MPSNANTLQLRLRWRDPKSGQQKEHTGPLPIAIGRHPDNTIVLNDPKISGHHARLEEQGNRILIVDQQSANGITINGQPVQQGELQDGSQFKVGFVRFRINIQRRAAPSRSAQSGTWVLRWTDAATNQSEERAIGSSLSIGRGSGSALLLQGDKVSGNHAHIEREGSDLILADLGSTNGTYLNGKRIKRKTLKPGDKIGVGKHTLTVAISRTVPRPPPAPPTISGQDTILGFDEDGTLVLERASKIHGPGLSIPAFNSSVVSIADLRRSGMQVFETTYLAIGGGLGSFVWVDHLLIFGADPRQIISVGLEPKPHGRYERLCKNSQIPHHERLRSNSDSCPDNIWGWPGYAVRESWYSFIRADFSNAIKVLWQIFVEPAKGLTYTPRAGDVFGSIDQEAARIGWSNIWRYGRVKAIRKTDDGRYAIAYSQTSKDKGRRQAVILAPYVHIAVGYPGVRFLQDLQRYREQTGDFQHVVNAYEAHDHVYRQLERQGGTVMVRGRGIVSSRIVQRLYEARQKNPNISILHLMRRPIAEGFRYKKAQRESDNHWEFQPFNWPKAGWGGDLRVLLEKATPQQRSQLLDQWGGTTTADRKDWREIVNQGLAGGWYQIRFGDVQRVERKSSQLVTTIRGKGGIQDEAELVTDFIIDGTGLESEIDKHPLLKDLIDHNGLEKNPKGRFHVENDFEIPGMRHNNSRMYASGVMTLGGPYAPVDSFLGLQYAALRSVDSLVALRAPGLRGLNGFRSFFQWLRWVQGATP